MHAALQAHPLRPRGFRLNTGTTLVPHASGPPCPTIATIIAASKAWPIVEAQRLLARVAKRPPAKGFVLFETGYGPSGLPHIGTFAEVFRTTLVRQAFARLSDLPTELYAFSDDMDGLRKVPDNVPNQAMVAEHLGRPLTAIPDPFGTHESYGAHMNARLQVVPRPVRLRLHLQERQRGVSQGHVQRRAPQGAGAARCRSARWCCRRWGRSGAPPTARSCRSRPRPAACCRCRSRSAGPPQGTVVFRDEDGTLTEVPVTDGHCKMQWKCDWALRWAALDVDYEMSGKDLIDSVKLSTQICRLLDGVPPESLTYELFLDELGQKISKSKGNGLTIEEWLRYGTRESLQLFLYREPTKAKRLHFDVIPRNVDDYEGFLDAFPRQLPAEQVGNPLWHIHDGRPPVERPRCRRASPSACS